ncbi:hypothetical protein PVAND_013602 [Polypedilum vanderplanki]|uniref:Kazal-like domain-containing protein n=1 Tax=Polypedilum vanderplanki TaxID=319348 RepID=A0A9J6CR71_POLVA|nr:hypothetical protein PVAND_013602 [Polypedilum vanderplanki]
MILIISSLPTSYEEVEIPEDCAQACPHHDGNFLCAKNTVTGQLGTFESECIFGRYNSCIKTTQQYEFVKYGKC